MTATNSPSVPLRTGDATPAPDTHPARADVRRSWLDTRRYDDAQDWAATQAREDADILDADMDLMSTFDDRADNDAYGAMSDMEWDSKRRGPE